MPPNDDILTQEQIAELIATFKESNKQIYDDLISATGATDDALSAFINAYSKDQGVHHDALSGILTANDSSNSDLQDSLDNFLDRFQGNVTRVGKHFDQVTAEFGSIDSAMQGELQQIQKRTAQLSKITSEGIGNMDKLMTSLSKTYATMAQRSKKVIQSATFDASAMDGRSIEGQLTVDVSSVGEFDSQINTTQDQLKGVAEEMKIAGDYLSAAAKERNTELTKQLANDQGILEAQKMSAQVLQDANGNYIDIEKSLEKVTSMTEEWEGHIADGNSHLITAIDLGKELQNASKMEMSAGLELKKLTDFKNELSGITSEKLKQEKIAEKLQEQQQFQIDLASALVAEEEKLPGLLDQSADIQERLSKMDPRSAEYAALQADLEGNEITIGKITDAQAELEASKLFTGQLEARMRISGEFEKSEGRVRDLAKQISGVVDSDGNVIEVGIETQMSEESKLQEQLQESIDTGTFEMAFGDTSGSLYGISTKEAKAIMNIKDDVAKTATLEELIRKSKERQSVLAKDRAIVESDITAENQHQVELSSREEGLEDGAMKNAKGKVEKTKEYVGKLKEAAETQLAMKRMGVWSDSAINQVTAFKDKILDVAGSVPIIGGALKSHLEKPLNKMTKKFGKLMGSTFKNMAKNIQAGMSPVEAMQNAFSGMGEKLKKIGGMAKGLLSPSVIAAGALLALLFLAVKRFMSLDAAAEDFRKEVGLGKDQTQEIESIARNVNVEFQKFGVSLEKAFSAAAALTEQFGTLVMSTRENVEMVALLGVNLGVSQANAAGALDIFSQLGDGSSETARNSMALATGMAKAAGVPLDKVLEDVAGASDETLSLLRGSTEELIRAAVEARRLGTNIETLSGAASHFLDFEGSIRAEMEASVFAGQQLSFHKARQLAFEGDLVGMQKASLETIKQAGEFTEMSYHQQQKLAAAAGMSVGEISKQLTREKQLESLKHGTAEQQAMYNRHLEMQKQLEEGNKKTIEQQGMEMLKQELMQSKMTQMKERFNALMIELGEKLLPLVEIGFALIVPVVKVLFTLAKLILTPFTVLADIVRALTGDFSGLSERFGSFGGIAMTVLGLIIGSVVLLKTNLLGIGPLIGKAATGIAGMFTGGISAVGKLGTATMDFFSGAGGAAAGLGTKLKDMFKAAGGKIKDMFSRTPTPPVPGKTTDVLDDITPDSAAVDKGVPDKASGMMDKFNKIDMKQVLKGAAALLILAAAVWVTAKAFKEFSDVEWAGVAKGIVGITALVIAAKFMEKGSTAMIKGAAAIAILGAALVPAALAFQMFSDVSWGSVLLGVGVLTVLGLAAALIAPFAPLIMTGAFAIGVLGLALIPFAIAAIVAGFAMGLVADAFVTMVGALQMLTFEDVLMIGALGVTLAVLGSMSPLIVAGAYAIGALAVGLLIMAGAAMIAGAGMSLFGEGLAMVGPALAGLAEGAIGLLLFAGAVALIGMMAPAVIAGAIAIGILGLAMIPVAVSAILVGLGMNLMAAAISEIGDANLAGIIIGLGLSFALLGLMIPFILVGAAAMGIMTVALIPFSIALMVAGAGMALFGMGLAMTVDSLKDMGEAAVGLLIFVGAVSLIGALAPLIILGAAVLAILGVALAILAIPLLITSAAMWILGSAFEMMADAIETMVDANAIGTIFGLGFAFIFLAAILPIVIFGALSLWIMTAALVPFAFAMMVAGVGMQMLVGGLEGLGPALASVAENAVGLGLLVAFFVGLAAMFPVIIVGSALAILMGVSLAFLGTGAMIAAGGVALLGLALMVMAGPLVSIMDGMTGLIGNLVELAIVSPLLLLAAVGIMAVAGALGILAIATIAYGIASLFTFGGPDPIEQFIRLGEVGPELEAAGKAIETFAFAAMFMGDMEDALEGVADGLEAIFEVMDGVSDSMGPKLQMIGEGMKSLLSAFSVEFLAFSVVADLEGSLSGLGEGIAELFGELEDVDMSIAPNLPVIGEGLSGLLAAFAGGIMFELNEDINDILGSLGEGVSDFFWYLEDINPEIIPVLGEIGPGISQLLISLGTEGLAEFDTDLEDVFAGLGAGIGELMWAIEGFDADQILAMGGMGDAVANILRGLGSIGEVDFDPDDFEDILESVGDGIGKLFEPMRNMDEELLETAAMVGGALGALFANIGTIGEVGDDWEDIFEGFGEGLEELFDEIDGLDKKSFGKVELVGEVLGELFGAFEGMNLTSELGVAVETLGEGIYELFDEIEEIDEEALEIGREVGKAVGQIFRNMPFEAMAKIPEDIGTKLNDLGYGIYEMFYEMDAEEFVDIIPFTGMIGDGIGKLIAGVSGDALGAIPDDIYDILEVVGEAVAEMFDEMEDIDPALAQPLGVAMGGLGTFFQSIAEMANQGVDISAVGNLSNSMANVMGALVELGEFFNPKKSFMDKLLGRESEGPDIGSMTEKMKEIGPAVSELFSAFSDIGTLTALEEIDLWAVADNITDGLRELFWELEDLDYEAALPAIYGISPAIKVLADAMSSFGTLGEVDVEDVMGGMADGISEIMYVMEDLDVDTLAKFTQISGAMGLMASSGSDITPILEGLQSIASQEFSDGLNRATMAIYDFAHALMAMGTVHTDLTASETASPAAAGTEPTIEGIPEEEQTTTNLEDLSRFSGGAFGASSVGRRVVPSAGSGGGGVVSEEQTSTSLEDLSRYSGGAFGKSSAAESLPAIVSSSAGGGGSSIDMSTVEGKLDQLIKLMRSGGIAVNLDGKKVNKGLAAAIESS